MGHDGAHHPPASRDARKKRQGNRSSAKLKQCKLDARREQWLSQVKDGKEATNTAPTIPTVPGSGKGAGSNAGSPILASPHPPLPRRRGDTRSRGGAPEEDAGAAGQDIGGGSSDFDSPMPSPGSDNSRGCGAQRKRCSSTGGGGPSLSSVSSLWSSSRSVSDAEDDDTGSGPDEVLDDWEAVADALSVDDDNHCHQRVGAMTPPAAPRNLAPPANMSKRTEPIRSNARAWKPDDMFRPQSLPSISKQASFPTGIGSCWGMRMGAAHQSTTLPSPASCPICYEDLDPTDSSFLPCPCGFHLCLFCHKRILEADGRCPGCRKQYNAVPAAGGGGGGAATAPVRISRSCSMGPRR
ncbi:hypothetical protein QYE76_044421 [Lolium multiflorum]|uniref:RING-type domain-containing protein n=1 Tax=Lolium multiflorum TaxID=4521 RepID=A0AAD8TL29_LOLMU|nr:hypothetical protein QYE76_044421 [Lolium multiflorum]